MRTKACIEVVVVASDGCFLLWDARGMNYVALDDESIARWVVELAEDEETPTVEFGAPKGGAWMQTATKIVNTLAKREGATEDAVGVHIVVQWQREPWSAVVWAPRGGPRATLSPAKLGEVLRELALDKGQPRVPAGAPPDPGQHIVEGIGDAISGWLRSPG